METKCRQGLRIAVAQIERLRPRTVQTDRRARRDGCDGDELRQTEVCCKPLHHAQRRGVAVALRGYAVVDSPASFTTINSWLDASRAMPIGLLRDVAPPVILRTGKTFPFAVREKTVTDGWTLLTTPISLLIGSTKRPTGPFQPGRGARNRANGSRVAACGAAVGVDGSGKSVGHDQLIIGRIDCHCFRAAQACRAAGQRAHRGGVAAGHTAVHRDRAAEIRDYKLVVHGVHRQAVGKIETRGVAGQGAKRCRIAACSAAVDGHRVQPTWPRIPHCAPFDGDTGRVAQAGEATDDAARRRGVAVGGTREHRYRVRVVVGDEHLALCPGRRTDRDAEQRDSSGPHRSPGKNRQQGFFCTHRKFLISRRTTDPGVENSARLPIQLPMES